MSAVPCHILGTWNATQCSLRDAHTLQVQLGDKSATWTAERALKRTAGDQVEAWEDLQTDLRFEVKGNTVTIYTDKVYAEIHNEGGTITVTPKMKKFFWFKNKEAKEAGDLDLAEQYKWMALAKKITIVQREFMGESDELNEKIVAKITRDLNRILN